MLHHRQGASPSWLVLGLAGTLALGATAALVYYRSYLRERNLHLEKKPLAAVGGHASKEAGVDEKEKKNTLHIIRGKVWKPFQAAQSGKKKGRGEVEADFYRFVNERNHPIKQFLPVFYGIEELEGTKYLVLEDLTKGFEHPCVLDLKIGTRAYDEEATPEKIAKEKKKYPPQEIVGFRFSGMKVYRPVTGEHFESTRNWCLSLLAHEVTEALETFFFDGENTRLGLVRSLVEQVANILHCLEEHPTWRFYGSSLLIVFDGAKAAPALGMMSTPGPGLTRRLNRKSSVHDLTLPNREIRVKMIDFAHVFPIRDGGKDYGYLHGLHFLMSSLNQILDRGIRKQGLPRGASSHIGASAHSPQSTSGYASGTDDTTSVGTGEGGGIVPVGGSRESTISFSVGVVSKKEKHPESFQREALFYEEVMESSDALVLVIPKLIRVVRDVHPRILMLEDVTNLVTKNSSGGGIPVGLRSPAQQQGGDHKRITPPNSTKAGSKNAHRGFSPSPSPRSPRRILPPNEMKRSLSSPTPTHRSVALGAGMAGATNGRPSTLSFALGVPPPLHMGPSALLGEEDSQMNGLYIMDCVLGTRSFFPDLGNDPEPQYFAQYEDLIRGIPRSQIGSIWESILLSAEGPSCLSESSLGQRDFLAFRDRFSTQEKLGFRIAAVSGEGCEITQSEANKISRREEFNKALFRFLCSPSGAFDSVLALAFLEEINDILEAISKSKIFPEYDFIGTSLLFLHQGKTAVVRWIDFEEIRKPSSLDRNGVQLGVENLRRAFEEVIFIHGAGSGNS